MKIELQVSDTWPNGEKREVPLLRAAYTVNGIEYAFQDGVTSIEQLQRFAANLGASAMSKLTEGK
jgi:hypothetical protein